MTRTIHDIIQEINVHVDDMASNLDIPTGLEIHKEDFQEMVFNTSPEGISELLFELADQVSLVLDLVVEIEEKVDPTLDFAEDLYENVPQTCDRCNKTLSRKEMRHDEC